MAMDGNSGNQFPQKQVYYPPEKRGFFSRHWFWLVPLCIVILGSPFICCGGFGLLAWGFAKAPSDAAVQAVNEDERAIEKLGSPIEKTSSGYQIEDFQIHNNQGHATLPGFRIAGPNGSGNLSGKMLFVDGVWLAGELRVDFDDGSYIEIPILTEENPSEETTVEESGNSDE